MRIYSFILICFLIPILGSTQAQDLQKYIEKGKTFPQIYNKASKMISKGKLSKNEKAKKYKEGQIIEEDGDYQRLERWAWYWRDRLNSDGSFMEPEDQRLIYKQYATENAHLRSNPQWKHEGPVRNSGGYWAMGRTTHIDFHPTNSSIFFVAAANGGLWKTIDGGLSYISLGEDLPQQPVGTVIVDPRNPNTIYITIGEKDGWWQYGLGVYKSIDGGTSWKPTGLSFKLNEQRVIYALSMDPSNSKNLIAATNKGIYKTQDGGVLWTRVRTEDFSDVKYKIGNSNILYAARNDYWGSCEIFQSTDGGTNWTQLSNFNIQRNFMRIQLTPANPEFIAVNASEDGKPKLYLSKNGGQKFDFISNLPENYVLFLSPTQEDVMYCGFVKVHKSYDGGYSWKEVTSWWNDGKNPEVHADHRFVSFDPRRKNHIYFCNDGGVHQYDENSETWKELSQNLPITQFYKMAISTTNPPVLIGGSQDNGGWLKRSNGTWGNTNGGDAMWQLIDPSDAKIMYSEYWGGRNVYRTTNSWIESVDIQPNVTGAQNQGQWVTPFNLNPKNPKTFIIAYQDIFVSHNRGNTFSKISTSLTGATDRSIRNVDISPVDTQVIFASYSNILYYTYNYGKNWSNVIMPVSNLEITSIEFHPTDVNKVWITRGGLGQFKIHESKDKGKTWKTITGNFPATPALVVRYDPSSNALFVGTDVGLFYSDADNINWQFYGKGLPNTSVTDIEFHQPTRKMYVSTYGRGFYSIDLPSCYPASLTIQSKVNNASYSFNDTTYVCLGDNISLKTNIDSLKGTYRWKGPQNFDTVILNTNSITLNSINSILKTGYYTLEFVSDKMCTRSDSLFIVVNQVAQPKIQSDFSEIDCNHPQVTLQNVNYSQLLSYKWLNNGKLIDDSASITINQAGTYILQAIQTKGNCIASDTITINKIDSPKSQYEIKHVNCFGEKTGSLKLSVQGGSEPYTIQYSDSNLISHPNMLYAGKYFIKLTDSRNCQLFDTITIAENEEIKVQLDIKNSTQKDGEIKAEISGGVKPYVLEWIYDNILIS
ncbi:MAG: hypothetical protein HOP11_09680, partial [Saprospiraceae bacterium]|nr:hypothetical protein [Saprospiraceae bacterium]